MPIKARATGIPTAQPTMTGTFDFSSGGEEVLDTAGLGVNVETTVEVKVLTPLLPEDTLVATDVTGVGVGVVVGFVSLDDEPFEDESGALVEEGDLPSSDTNPVMLARFGALDAVDCPIIAYCWPSPREKNGRGSGDSLQQSTLVLSPSQHH